MRLIGLTGLKLIRNKGLLKNTHSISLLDEECVWYDINKLKISEGK